MDNLNMDNLNNARGPVLGSQVPARLNTCRALHITREGAIDIKKSSITLVARVWLTFKTLITAGSFSFVSKKNILQAVKSISLPSLSSVQQLKTVRQMLCVLDCLAINKGEHKELLIEIKAKVSETVELQINFLKSGLVDSPRQALALVRELLQTVESAKKYNFLTEDKRGEYYASLLPELAKLSINDGLNSQEKSALVNQIFVILETLDLDSIDKKFKVDLLLGFTTLAANNVFKDVSTDNRIELVGKILDILRDVDLTSLELSDCNIVVENNVVVENLKGMIQSHSNLLETLYRSPDSSQQQLKVEQHLLVHLASYIAQRSDALKEIGKQSYRGLVGARLNVAFGDRRENVNVEKKIELVKGILSTLHLLNLQLGLNNGDIDWMQSINQQVIEGVRSEISSLEAGGIAPKEKEEGIGHLFGALLSFVKTARQFDYAENKIAPVDHDLAQLTREGVVRLINSQEEAPSAENIANTLVELQSRDLDVGERMMCCMRLLPALKHPESQEQMTNVRDGLFQFLNAQGNFIRPDSELSSDEKLEVLTLLVTVRECLEQIADPDKTSVLTQVIQTILESVDEAQRSDIKNLLQSLRDIKQSFQ